MASLRLGTRCGQLLSRKNVLLRQNTGGYLLERRFELQFGNKRHFWTWLNLIFNRYDSSRVKEVGPDRACAEWLLRCGAGVQWNRGGGDWLRDYNALPVTNDRSMKIIAVDGTDSAVMDVGFYHFRGVEQCKKMVFHKASYFDNSCIHELTAPGLRESLTDLQISSCGNVTSAGILMLKDLPNLEKLLLYDFPAVNNRLECIETLRKALPRCHVEFPYAQASERTEEMSQKS